MVGELGRRPEGNGTLCPFGRGCSEQGTFFFPPSNIRAASLRARRCVGRGGVPSVEVPYGPPLVELMMGDGEGARLGPGGGLERRFGRV